MPKRTDLKSILIHFLEFRLLVVTRRLQHELEGLLRRIHILEGRRIVGDDLPSHRLIGVVGQEHVGSHPTRLRFRYGLQRHPNPEVSLTPGRRFLDDDISAQRTEVPAIEPNPRANDRPSLF